MVLQFLTIFILLYTCTKVQGTCHMCQSNLAACHDESHFTMCSDGIPDDRLQTCPDGYVCTDETGICLQSTETNPVQSTCENGCDVCNSPNKLFACIDEKTYVFCFGTDAPNYNEIGICPDGYVCNLGYNQICIPASNVYPSCYNGASTAPTTLSPTTTPGTDVTSNPSSPINPTETPATTEDTTVTQEDNAESVTTHNPQDTSAFCSDKQEEGLYKAANDPTCREYIFCFILSGQYLGNKYTCSDTEYFNEAAGRCQAERPDNC